MAWRLGWRTSEDPALSGLDHTRGRIAAINQLLLGSVVLVLALIVATLPYPGDLRLFFLGVLMVFVATAASLVIPWNRMSLAWLALVPAVDIVAIAFMRISSPESGLGLLWIFPAMWLPMSFGFAGLLAAILGISIAFGITILLAPTEVLQYSALLLPLVISAVAGTSLLAARRSAAQRMLLDKQARLLRRSLERARRQEQEVTEVLDAVDFGVIRIGADGSVSVTNDAHARLQHALRREPGADDPPAFRDDGVTPLPDDQLPLERALRGHAIDNEVIWFGEPGEERRALSVTVRRLRDGTGADAGAVLVSRDITAELSALRARDNLVASVSHELRTPLTSILGYLDLAIDDPTVPASARKGLEIAERNAERLLAIVADILAASSSSQKSVELTISPADIDVADVVRGAVESLQPRADERAVSIDLSGIEPARAYADSMRLRQVIDNLITNGIKYNREGGTVVVGCTSEGDSTWVLVRDTGRGMSEDEMAGLFERFYRARSLRGTGMHGSGLGLAISRDIARAHGGDITVHSTPGVGSTFIVRLPATRAAASPAPRIPGSTSPETAPIAVGPRRRGNPE